MNAELLSYVLNELSEHMERISDIATNEEPDLETLEFHKVRSNKIINLIGDSFKQQPNNIRVIGGN